MKPMKNCYKRGEEKSEGETGEYCQEYIRQWMATSSKASLHINTLKRKNKKLMGQNLTLVCQDSRTVRNKSMLFKPVNK
jgi:hypothetical protein